MLNKDFYDNLPGMVCVVLEEFIEKYSKEQWFEDAWEEYRQHILNSSMGDMRMPNYIFNKFTNKESEEK